MGNAAKAIAATETQLKICDNGKDINDTLRETTHSENLANTLTYCRTIISLLSDKMSEEYHDIAEMQKELAKQSDITLQLRCANIEKEASKISMGIFSIERMLENACEDFDL